MPGFRYTLTIKSAQFYNCMEVAEQVAQTLPSAQWVQDKPEVLLADLDFQAIGTAIALEGGLDWKIKDHKIAFL